MAVVDGWQRSPYTTSRPLRQPVSVGEQVAQSETGGLTHEVTAPQKSPIRSPKFPDRRPEAKMEPISGTGNAPERRRILCMAIASPMTSAAFPQPTPEDLADIVRRFELTERAYDRREVCKILKISDDSVDRLTASGGFAGHRGNQTNHHNWPAGFGDNYMAPSATSRSQ
jgi:hypothetical protein